MNLSGKRVLVAGMGAGGMAAVAFCCRGGALVSVTDADDEVRRRYAAAVRRLGAAVVSISHREAAAGADLVVLGAPASPKVHWEPLLCAGPPVLGTVGLAGLFCKAPVVAVVGAPETAWMTVRLTGRMLETTGRRVFQARGGNGAVFEAAEEADRDDVVIVTIEEHQLALTGEFTPRTAVFVTETRLGSGGGYPPITDLFSRLGASDIAVAGDDPRLVPLLESGLKARLLTYTHAPLPRPGREEGAVIRNGCIRFRLRSHTAGSVSIARCCPDGAWEREIAAAGLAAISMGTHLVDIRDVLSDFAFPRRNRNPNTDTLDVPLSLHTTRRKGISHV